MSLTSPKELSRIVLVCLLAASCGDSKSPTAPSSGTRLSELTLAAPSITGGIPVEGAVVLSIPAGRGGLTVTLSSSDAAATLPSSVLIADGSSRGTFTVTTHVVTVETSVAISAAAAGDSKGVVLRLMPLRAPVLDALEFDPSVVVSGNSTRGTVRLDKASPSGTTVSLSSDDTAIMVPPTVLVPAGETSATFTANTREVDSPVVPRVTASAGGESRTVAVTLQPRPLPTIQTFFSFVSAAGDYIGQGRTVTYTPSNAYLAANAVCGGKMLTVRVETGNANTWWIRMEAPQGSTLKQGTYSNATRWPFQATNMPGLDVTGEGRGCNTSYGSFEVKQAAFTSSGAVRRFHATFEQRCGLPTSPILRGEISLNDVPQSNDAGSCR